MLVRVLQEIVSSYLMKQSALLNSSAGAEASKIQDKAKASPESLNSSRQAPCFGKIEVELEHTLCVPRARAELVRLLENVLFFHVKRRQLSGQPKLLSTPHFQEFEKTASL